MKKIVILALSLTLVGSAGYATGTASGAGGSRYLAASILANAGSIHGFVNCGGHGESKTPREWSTVWVQGHSYSARTDENGEFVIDYVPPGTYTLGVQTSGMPIRQPLFEVTVFARATTVADGDTSEAGVQPLHVIGGCGNSCSGGGGGGHDTGGGCEGDTGGGCEGDTGGGCEGDTGGGCEGDTGGGCSG
jgi:hypothetical protein